MSDPDLKTGLLDFGASTILADRRLAPLLATALLDPRVASSTRIDDLRWTEARLASQ